MGNIMDTQSLMEAFLRHRKQLFRYLCAIG